MSESNEIRRWLHGVDEEPLENFAIELAAHPNRVYVLEDWDVDVIVMMSPQEYRRFKELDAKEANPSPRSPSRIDTH